MKLPARRDLAIWAALVVIAGLVILDTPRATLDWYAIGGFVLTAVVTMPVAVFRERRSGGSWTRTIGVALFNVGAVVGLGSAYVVLSMNFGKVPADPFDIPIDPIGWVLLAIALVFVWVAVARVIEIGPFRPKPMPR